MFGISFAHKGNRRVAVADIGSASAGVAIVSLTKGKPARIEALHRVTLPIEERSQEQSIAGITSALSEATTKVLEAGKTLGPVQSVHAVIREPWVRSKTIRAVKKFPKDERVGKELIAQLAREALASETEFNHANLIEANVVRVELNGYPTAEPVGKEAHSVFVSAVVSECEPRIKSAVEEALARAFSSKTTCRSGTSALLSVLRERSRTHTDYLVLNMTGSATSMFVVHKGAPLEHVQIPEGTQTILKRVAGNKMPEETLSLIRMLAREQCEDAACDEIQAGMAKTEQELIRIFGEAIAKLAATQRLPNSMVLAIEPDLAHWFTSFFSRIDFTQFTITAQPFMVEVLAPEHLNALVELSPHQNIDIGLMTAVGLVNSEPESA